jgi:hypothetical protein
LDGKTEEKMVEMAEIVTITLTPGADIMITFISDFANILRKNWRCSQKPML